MASETITYEATGRVARITLDRPERGNAITLEMPHELSACVERANLDPEIHVIALSGNGSGFCGGYDLVASAEGMGGGASADPAAPGREAEEADGGFLVVRSEAGHDFCGFEENWKMHAPVFVRDTDELLREVYPEMSHCDPEWMELREFYCPASGRMLEVEAVTPGYPVVHDFLPDIEGFYAGWLGREVPKAR